MFEIPILSLSIFLPVIAVLVILLIKGEEHVIKKNIKSIAVLTAFINLILSIYMMVSFDKVIPYAQFAENITLISSINFGYHLGVDGISLAFILVSNLLFCFIFLFVKFPQEKVKLYTISLLMIMAAAVGTFASLDIIMFYVFYEFSIIPVFFIMGVFGSGNKFYATFKFFLYTAFGSMFMVIAILLMVMITKDSNIVSMASFPFTKEYQQYLFWAMFIAFSVKVALIPVHTWLPDTYDSSPLYMNIILSGVLMKYGLYGFIKLVLPIFSIAIVDNLSIIYFLCLATLIYSGLIAIKANNIKRLFAYLSISHVALMVAGVFSGTTQGLEGAVFQALSHSVYNLGIFLSLIYLHKRYKSNLVSDFSGIANVMPSFAIIFMLLSIAVMAFPLTNAFIGEVLVLFGIFQENRLFATGFSLTMIITAITIISLNKKFLFMQTSECLVRAKDLSIKELVPLLLIVAIILVMGIYPDLILDILHISVSNLLDQFKNGILVKNVF